MKSTQIFFIALLLILAGACDNTVKIDKEACLQKNDECNQYSCLHPGCWCLPEEDGSFYLYDGRVDINSEKEAEKVIKSYIEKTDFQYEILEVGKIDNGWYYVELVRSGTTEKVRLTITPKAKICRTECGI